MNFKKLLILFSLIILISGCVSGTVEINEDGTEKTTKSLGIIKHTFTDEDGTLIISKNTISKTAKLDQTTTIDEETLDFFEPREVLEIICEMYSEMFFGEESFDELLAGMEEIESDEPAEENVLEGYTVTEVVLKMNHEQSGALAGKCIVNGDINSGITYF
jgi:hypothetical protein